MKHIGSKLSLFFVPAEMVKYLIAGGIAFFADASILYCLTEFAGWHYLVSNTAGFSAGLIVSYLLNIWWVFADRKYQFRIMAEFPIFFAIVASGYLINQLVLWTFVEFVNIDYIVGKVFATAFVMAFNFVAKKFLLFSNAG